MRAREAKIRSRCGRGTDRHPCLLEEAGAADDQTAAVEGGLDAVTGPRQERGRLDERQPLRLRCAHDGGREWMFGAAFSRCREAKQFGDCELHAVCGGQRHDVGDLWTSHGDRAGLVEHDGVDGVRALEHIAAFDEDAALGAPSRPDEDCGGRRQAHGARARDDEHRDEVHQGRRAAGARRQQVEPDNEGADRDHEYSRGEDARDDVRHARDRGAAPLRFLHEPDDLLKRGVAADTRRAEPERAGAVHASPEHGAAGLLVHRQRLAGEHRLIHRGRAVEPLAVDRQPLAGPHDDDVARQDPGDGHGELDAVADDAGVARLKPDEPANGVRRARARPRLQKPAEQHEDDDCGRHLVGTRRAP